MVAGAPGREEDVRGSGVLGQRRLRDVGLVGVAAGVGPVGPRRADHEIAAAVAVRVGQPRHRAAEAVVAARAQHDECRAAGCGEADGVRGGAAEHDVRGARVLGRSPASASGAPTRTSSRPSPLTSPIPATAAPAVSNGAAPSMRKPCAAATLPDSGSLLPVPNTTQAAPVFVC